MKVDWFRENPISYYPDIELPEFRIQSVKAEKCNGTFTYSRTERSAKTGMWRKLIQILLFQIYLVIAITAVTKTSA
jgi:hypothetical protein